MSDGFRTPETKRRYDEFRNSGGLLRSCPLCDAKSIDTFTYWRIIPNEFPYDLIAEVHHMIIPIRHVTEPELSTDEREEFGRIKESYMQKYRYIIESTSSTKSIPAHFHQHLIVDRRGRE
jgi:diadenosine tetraphosphate (Ap4A) HIT family hydrolase